MKKELENLKNKLVNYQVIVSILLIALFCLIMAVNSNLNDKLKQNSIEFETVVVNLDNNNDMLYGVQEYMCTQGVYVNEHSGNSLYVSTWSNDRLKGKATEKHGTCIIKRIK